MPDENEDRRSGNERRQNCRECVSHREHSALINALGVGMGEAKGEHVGMWADIKSKVPYAHFLWALGTILTIVIFASGLNYKSMEKVLSTTHRVELEVGSIKSEIKHTNDTLKSKAKEHESFREAILQIQRQVFELTQRQTELLKLYEGPNGG